MTATKTKKIAASLAGFSMLVSAAAPAFAVGDPETSAETPNIVLVDTPDEPEEVEEESKDIQEKVIAPADEEDVVDDFSDAVAPMSDEAETDTDTDTGGDTPTSPSFESTPAYTVVERAMAQLGKPFQFGACGPDAFDSSGLVSYCLTGQSIRLGTVATFLGYPAVDDPQPGDIVCRAGSCGIYVGSGQMIVCHGAGSSVRLMPAFADATYHRAPWVVDKLPVKEVDCSISFVDENDKEIAPVVESTIEVAENEALLGSVEELARKNPIAGYSIVRVAAADPEVVDGVHQFIAYCEPNGNGGGNGEGDNNPEFPDAPQDKSIAVFCVDEKGNLLDERMVSDTALDDIEAPVLAGWQYVDRYQKDGSHYNDFVPAGSASVSISHWSAEYPDENQMFNPDKNDSSDPSVPDFVDIPADGVAISGLIEESAVPSDEDWIGKAIIITTTNGTITANVSGFITNKFGYTIKLGESLSAAIPEDEGIISIDGIELAPSDPNFPEPKACLYFVYNRTTDFPGDNEKPGDPDDPSTPADPDATDTPNPPDNPVVPSSPVDEEGVGNTAKEETENNDSGDGEALVDDQIPETGELVQTGDATPFIPVSVAALASLAALATAYITRKKHD